MALPGNLTVGLLHEDNPSKSFFRMKPILTDEGNGFVPSEIDEKFPEEGFVRIVPDKNEIAMFKTRMRQMGRYCALDLRKHFSENDKIRPNKNYIPGGPERNAFIVYSDVIGRLPLEQIAEVVDTEEPLGVNLIRQTMELPGTAYVILRHGSKLSGPWSWEASEIEPGVVTLQHAEDQPFSELDDDVLSGNSLDIPIDETANALLLYDLSAFMLRSVMLPEVERPTLERTPVESMPKSTSQIMGRDPLSSDVFRSLDAAMASQIAAKPEDAPWLMKNDILRPRAGGRLGASAHAAVARSGRSLYEVVDEQWRRSRIDQLGHPAPAQGMGRPITSPVERAAQLVNEAWSINEARATLVSELLRNEDLRQSLSDALSAGGGSSASRELNGQLSELEASRLKLIGEIDALRLKRDETKNQLLDELRGGYRQELSEYERQIKSLQGEVASNEKKAQDALSAARIKQQLLDETDAQLTERIKTSALDSQMCALLGVDTVPESHPTTYEPTAGELISDVRVQMERAGFPLTNDEAVNLLGCLMAGGSLIVSGPSGSGKTGIVRRLADALGLGGEAARFVEAKTPEDDAVSDLMAIADCSTPRMVLLDDVNTGRTDKHIGEVFRLQERAITAGVPLKLLLTAQDAPDGHPLPARLLGRSFLLRLDGAPSDANWKPSAVVAPDPGRAVALSALRRIFPVNGELPGEIEERLNKLRTSLAKLNHVIDRRTLDELWHYCAAARPLMQCSNLELLDLALSQRALPQMLASMDIQALHALPQLLADMPRCLKLMDQPLPLPPL